MLNQKNIRLIISGLVLLVIGGCLYFISTHGRLNLVGVSAKPVLLVKISGNHFDEPTETKNGAFISSGEYVVRNQTDSTERLIHVTVPGWLQTVTKSFSVTSSPETKRIAALTYERFFQSDANSLVSYSDLTDIVAGYTIHPENDPYGGKYSDVPFTDDLTSPVIAPDGKLFVIKESKVAAYTFKDRVMHFIPGGEVDSPQTGSAENDTTLFPSLHRSTDMSSDKIGVFEKLRNSLKIIDTHDHITSYKLEINNPRGNVLDFNDTYIGAVNINEYRSKGIDTKNEDIPIDYSVTLFNLKNKQTTTIDIGSANRVSGLAISPDGSYIAVIKDGQLWVYRVNDSSVVMIEPFTTIHQLFWKQSKLYALSVDTGLNVFDTTTLELQSLGLGDTTSLSFSNLVPVGNQLYATAFNLKQDSKLPDGFVINLSQPSNGVTAKLASKLPYEGAEYDINYLNNTIYIRINYYSPANSPLAATHVEEIKKQASERLAELIDSQTLKKCSILFLN